MLSWIKRRVRDYEEFAWDGTVYNRKFLIESAVQDYKWAKGIK